MESNSLISIESLSSSGARAICWKIIKGCRSRAERRACQLGNVTILIVSFLFLPQIGFLLSVFYIDTWAYIDFHSVLRLALRSMAGSVYDSRGWSVHSGATDELSIIVETLLADVQKEQEDKKIFPTSDRHHLPSAWLRLDWPPCVRDRSMTFILFLFFSLSLLLKILPVVHYLSSYFGRPVENVRERENKMKKNEAEEEKKQEKEREGFMKPSATEMD